jgi:hypothetical protein
MAQRAGLVVALVAAGLGLQSQARADRPEACFAYSPATPVTPGSCTYTATVPGGIDGGGTFVVTIAGPDGTTTVDSRDLPPEPTCYAEGPRALCPIGIVQPGDVVTVIALAPPTAVGVGNPCPVSNPGVPPPILGGPC